MLISQVKDVTAKIKQLADVRTQTMEDIDVLLRVYHRGIKSGELEVGDHDKLDELLQEHVEAASPVKAKVNGVNGHAPVANGVH